MMKIFKNGCFALIILALASCQKGDFNEGTSTSKVNISFEQQGGRLILPQGNQEIEKSSTKAYFPIKITLDGPAPEIFSVNLGSNQDTVLGLVSSNNITNAIALTKSEFSIPQQLDIPFGYTEFTFNAGINLIDIEKHYGKNMVFSIILTGTSKGNTLSKFKKTLIVVVNTAQILSQEELHFVSFTYAKAPYKIPTERSYVIGTTQITIPVEIGYSGAFSSSFKVKVKNNTDSLNRLISGGTIPNLKAVSASNFSYSTEVQFNDKKKTAKFNVVVDLAQITSNMGKKMGIVLSLADPDKYELDENKNSLFLLIDTYAFSRPYYGAPHLISGNIGKETYIKAADFDLGGQGFAYNDNTVANQGGTYRLAEGVDIEANGNNVSNTITGEWMYYTVNIEQAGTYSLDVSVASPNNPGAFRLELDEVNITGSMVLPKTGAWATYVKVNKQVHLPAGVHKLKFYFENATGNLAGFTFRRID